MLVMFAPCKLTRGKHNPLPLSQPTAVAVLCLMVVGMWPLRFTGPDAVSASYRMIAIGSRTMYASTRRMGAAVIEPSASSQ